MNRSYPVWENAAPPQPGPAMTFHRWRNNIMRIVPILGVVVLIMSLIMISDLTLLILQAIADGLAIIYIVPSLIISQQDGDSTYDMVVLEFLLICVAAGLWLGSIIRIATLRTLPYCGGLEDRLLYINFGGQSDIQCTFSIITIIGSSVIVAACLLWLFMLLVAMHITPHKQFKQTWYMAAHRLARGNEVGAVDLYEQDVEAHREVPGFPSTIQPFTGGLADARRFSQADSGRQGGTPGREVVSQLDGPDEPPPAYRPTASRGTPSIDWDRRQRANNNVVREL